MEIKPSNTIPRKSGWKRIAIIIFLTAIAIISWARFTKIWYIPNFLNIGILCPEIEEDPYYPQGESMWKPVIYLYPKQKQNILVQLNYQGKIMADYPDYDSKLNGWEVTAYPDGKIINHLDNQEYNYLFWEGEPKQKIDWDLSKGFIVKGEDTKQFLQQKLSQIGLTPKEYNEFIVYWYPVLQHNAYNLIHFADKQYTDIAPLTISPQPDAILRVFMVYKPLEDMINIEEQKLKTFERKSFTVVEWGGTKAE